MNGVQKFLRSFLRTFLVSFFLVSVLFLFLSAWLASALWERGALLAEGFAKEAGRSPWSILAELGSGYALGPYTEPQRWLVLGTDEIVGSNRPSILTDTIILVSYDPQKNTIKLLSFPRDIYNPQQQVRVNSLYRLALESGEKAPEGFVQTVFSEMIGQRIDRTILLSPDDLAGLIDSIGGLPVVVERGFTDPEFPRSGVDVTIERDPTILYETVKFEAGPQVMNGETAMKFIRSRKALQIEEAGDEARVKRQRLVIESLLRRLQSPEVLGNPIILGRVYDWYSRHLLVQFPLSVLGRLARTALAQEQFPALESLSLPVTEYPVATDRATLFVHPDLEKYDGQWVFEPVDPSWAQLREFIRENGL